MQELKENNILKAVLVAVDDGSSADFEYFISEMKNLIEACDMEVVETVIQSMANPNPTTYIGTGKLEELRGIADFEDADYCIFADNLSPAQLNNITDGVDTAVLDRTGLILEIFARRARTREARLQVESANLQYMLPRLVGMRKSLGRQAGASGSLSNKGQGEKQLELDRRHIERKIAELNRELKDIEHDRNIQRARRERNNVPTVALVGYTNAGKSTLMNRLLDISGTEEEKKVFEKDMLFATLDTTVRRIDFNDNKSFLLSDTVGFISNLPHGLVKAFRSTLEEAVRADLLLIVLDSADPHVNEERETTEATLKALECEKIPRIYVMNKCDKLIMTPENTASPEMRAYISARTGAGIAELVAMVKDALYKSNEIIELVIPYNEGALLDLINREGNVLATEYREDGTYIKADLPAHIAGKVKKERYE